MDEKEAELIGMHVGDGTLYLSGKTLVWEMRGSVNEKEYYVHVSELVNKTLNIELKPKYRGTNSYGIQTTDKTITSFFVNSGFNPGRKVYTATIPDYIKNSSTSIKLSFVRGLFDTDGCLRFEKNRTKVRYYPRIEFSFASKNLRNGLYDLLSELNFKVYRWQDRGYNSLGLAGFENLKKWIQEVKPSNSKHTKKIETIKLKSLIFSH